MISPKLFYFVAYTATFIALLTAMIGFLKFNKLTKPFKVILFWTAFFVISEITAEILARKAIPNLAIYHALGFFKIIAFTAAFWMMPPFKKIKPFLLASTGLLCGLSMLEMFQSNNFTQLNQFTSWFTCLYFLICGIYFFYITIKKLFYDDIIKEPKFWFFGGLILYASNASVLHAYGNFLFVENEFDLKITWLVMSGFIAIFHIFLSISFWKH